MTFKRDVKLDTSHVKDKRPTPGYVRRTGPTNAPKARPAAPKGGGRKTTR